MPSSSSDSTPTRYSIIDVNDSLIARGAFGHVDIALLSTSSSSDTTHTNNVQSLSLAAIKTIPNATTIQSSLTREAFAELNALRLLNGHENVTSLLGYYGGSQSTSSGFGGSGWDWAEGSSAVQTSSSSSLCLAFPYHPVDLADALNYRRLKSFSNGAPYHAFHLPKLVIQSIIYDVLSGLKHIHEHYILHRDIKPGNLYITTGGRIQIGDFGLAKAVPPSSMQDKSSQTKDKNTISNDDEKVVTYNSEPNVTQGLCTLQYRPPELLLGGTGIIIHQSDTNGDDDAVNGAFDIWSAGCIFVELLTLSGPLFPGQSVLDQLGRIFNILGTPTNDTWPGVNELPDWNKVQFDSMTGSGIQEKVVEKDVWNNVGDLISKVLSLDPLKRPSAKQCLSHQWLQLDDTSRMKSHQSVVDELIPSILHITNPIYFSPTTSNEIKCTPQDYAKQYASNLASTRRSFPQSIEDDSKRVDNERWKCSAR